MALFLVMAVLGVIQAFTMGWTGFGMMGMDFGAVGLVMAIPAIVLVLILLVVLGAFDLPVPRLEDTSPVPQPLAYVAGR